jgi:hypothetical protein
VCCVRGLAWHALMEHRALAKPQPDSMKGIKFFLHAIGDPFTFCFVLFVFWWSWCITFRAVHVSVLYYLSHIPKIFGGFFFFFLWEEPFTFRTVANLAYLNKLSTFQKISSFYLIFFSL